MKEVTTDCDQVSDTRDTFFLETVSNHASSAWFVNLRMCGKDMKFKIDTGADITVIPLTSYNQLSDRPPLRNSDAKLIGPGGHLECRGYFVADITHNSQKHSIEVYVANSPNISHLLGRNEASSMGLVKRIETVVDAYTDVFGEIGLMKCSPVKIKLRAGAEPYSVVTPRRIPFPQMKTVEDELKRMVKMGIIEPITEPTEWCAPMVPVTKKDGRVRICVDLKRLNEAVQRERLVLPTLDDVSPDLVGSSVFSTLDASSGFWQVPLDSESSKLTTFITPWGRFCFKRVPFGITSAPEIFQRKMTELLHGLPGVKAIMDDVLVYGNADNHESRLTQVLDRIRSSGLKLNKRKCHFHQEEVRYFGHLLSKNGIQPDAQKVEAIQQLPAPTNLEELRRVLGMTNYLGRFLPDLSTRIQPLHELLKSDVAWYWGPAQEKAFTLLKTLVCQAPALAFYDPTKPVVITADASSYGIGGALLQSHDGVLQPVAYCSRTLTETEKRYAQIEKELLAGVWVCERLNRYLVGLDKFILQTDHKPLLSVINSQDLDKAPLRCQRLLMRLMRFHIQAEYVPGKDLVIADMLSRSPLQSCSLSDTEQDVTAYVDAVMQSQPVASKKICQVQEATAKDTMLTAAMQFCLDGWPDYIRDVPENLHKLSVVNQMLLYGDRIVIPEVLRSYILDKLHEGHQGVTKCKERANLTVWWPGIGQDIVDKISICSYCQEHKSLQRKEPLLTTKLPDRPWQRVAADLCEIGKDRYLVLMDYLSRYLEIVHMTKTTSTHVIGKMKNVFAHWGIPEVLVTDNGPQFVSLEFNEFTDEFGFFHETTSPYFPQANGQAERGVQIAKSILKQKDPIVALMNYRATPSTPTGVSPCQLMMGRQINTKLPTLEKNLQPQWPDLENVRETDRKTKQDYAKYFNRRHGVRPLRELQEQDRVLLRMNKGGRWNTEATVVSQHSTPRSYTVKTADGEYRRN